jgi:hypothetical protein
MGSSTAVGELRLPASDDSGAEPRHRDVRGEDPWFHPGVAPRDYPDPPRSERGSLYRGTLDGITNWPDDSPTLPGDATSPPVVDPLSEVPAGVVPAHTQAGIERGHRIVSPGTGDKAVGNPTKEPAAAVAGARPLAAESSEGKTDAGGSDGSSALGITERAHHRVMLRHRIAGVLGTTRGKWAVAATAATTALVALGVVLAVHSHHTPAGMVPQASDDSPAATSSDPSASYPAPPAASATPSAPSQDTDAPPTSDSQAAVSDPSPAVGSPSQAMPPNAPVPPGQPSDDPLTPSAPMPLDPAPNDPQLDQTQPVGPDWTQATPTQGRAGLAGPRGRPDDRATTPRNSSPLRNSLDSITAPHRPDNSDRGDSDSRGRSKSFGDVPGLGRGL